MAGMKKLYEESDDDALDDAIDSAYRDAENNPARAIEILRDCYVKYQADNDKILSVATNHDALQWLSDYWAFVRDTEHGNEPSIAEIDGFSGFAQIIAYPDMAEQTMDYLLYDDYDKIDDEARDLIDRLTNLTGVAMAKMKKKYAMFKDDVKSYFIDITDRTNGFGAVLDFDWNEDSVTVSPKTNDLHHNTVFCRYFKDAVDNISRDDEMNVSYFDETRCIVCIQAKDPYSASTKKMEKSVSDKIPQTFYVDLDSGRSITFSKEEYPMGVRWLHDNKDVRFYTTEGTEVFPVLQFSDSSSDKALMLFEEKGWANDYYGEHTDVTGIDAVIEFEEFINDMLAGDVYVDYGDEDIMESTKKMKKSIDEDAVFDFIKNSNSCCYGEIYDYCKDIGMSDQQIDDAISNLKSEGRIDFVNQMDYVIKMKKSEEGITKEDIDSIEQAFEYDGWDVAGWCEYSSNLGFTRPWWVIRDVGIDDFGALQRITQSVIPSKFQYGLDYEFSRHGNDHTVSLHFLIPYVGDAYDTAIHYNGQMRKSTSSIHDMIAQTRANNNSLTKNRINL